MTGPVLEQVRAAAPSAAVADGDGLLTVDVEPSEWVLAATAARDHGGFTFLDFLSAVDESDAMRVVCHLVSPAPFQHLMLRCLLAADRPTLASLAPLYAGARWHERETAEMFGISFLDEAGAVLPSPPLLLADGAAHHPLRKSFLLQPRLERPWPGAKEPGESDGDVSSSRRRLRPPGVPEGLA